MRRKVESEWKYIAGKLESEDSSEDPVTVDNVGG
jgi:hypothetical protein